MVRAASIPNIINALFKFAITDLFLENKAKSPLFNFSLCSGWFHWKVTKSLLRCCARDAQAVPQQVITKQSHSSCPRLMASKGFGEEWNVKFRHGQHVDSQSEESIFFSEISQGAGGWKEVMELPEGNLSRCVIQRTPTNKWAMTYVRPATTTIVSSS